MVDCVKTETCAQLFCRLGSKQSINGVDNTLFQDLPQPIQAQDVIELYGKEGCGKTQILLHLIANCILPRSWEGLSLDGRGVSVVFIDTDYHFPLLRLIEILEHRILTCMSTQTSSSPHHTTNNRQIFIKTCLSRLILVHCNSSAQLLATVESLDDILSNKPEICVLMIDSISAFYWLDKYNAGNSIYDQEKYQRKLVALLKKYIQMYFLVVFATKPAIFYKEAGQQQQREHHEYMSRDWQNLVKYRYLIIPTLNSAFLFKRIRPAGKTSLQFSVNKAGLVFSGSCRK